MRCNTAAEDTNATGFVVFIISTSIWDKAGAFKGSLFAIVGKFIEVILSGALPYKNDASVFSHRLLYSSFMHFEKLSLLCPWSF